CFTYSSLHSPLPSHTISLIFVSILLVSCLPPSPLLLFFLFSIIRPPPISTLFPYTTLFRSAFVYNRDVVDTLTGHFEDDMTRCVDRKSTRLNSSHVSISYAVFCLKKKKGELQYHSKRS